FWYSILEELLHILEIFAQRQNPKNINIPPLLFSSITMSAIIRTFVIVPYNSFWGLGPNNGLHP
ncbi:hypothetical protein ACJX0J_030366, partial [Zea mays]